MHGIFLGQYFGDRYGAGSFFGLNLWPPRPLLVEGIFSSNPPSISPLRTHAGLTTRIVESPGLSLAPSRSRRTGSRSFARLAPARRCRPGSLTYGIFSGDREKLSRAIVTLISDEATGHAIRL